VYDVINYGGAAAVSDIKDLFKLTRDNILTYIGAEVRLEARTFSSYPLALSTRWDYGLDRKAPLGGSRFSFKIGFSFDDWDILLDPSGKRGGFTPYIGKNN
jgi:hypothetical protein